MTTSKQCRTILFTHFGADWIRGSERCLLDLLAHLDRRRFRPILWCNSPRLAAAAAALDVTVELDTFSLLLGWTRPRFNMHAFLRQRRRGIALVDRYQVDLLHANSGAPCQWLNLVARARDLPLVAHLHSRYPLRDRLTLGLHHVSLAVGVSEPVVAQLISDGMPQARTRVIANGIDVQRFDSAEPLAMHAELGFGVDDFVLLSAGSLIRRKGMDLLIGCVAKLRKMGVPAKLMIVGEGPERAALAQQIKDTGMSGHVSLLGERTDLPRLLRGGIDVFVSAAREEVFGLVLAEAALAGLPAVAPAVGGIPGVVLDEVSGILVAPECTHSPAQALAELYHDPHARRRMGLAARAHVLENFTIARNTRTFEKVYEKVLREEAAPPPWFARGNGLLPLRHALGMLFVQPLRSLRAHSAIPEREY